jgi:hypothetical protein
MYYAAYGLQVASELCLPELLPTSPVTHPDVHIRYGSVPAALDNPAGQGVVYQALPDQLLLRLDGIANYLISDGKTITIEPAPASREEDIRVFLLGSSFGALLHQRGVLPLHGSAIVTQYGAVVFVAHSGVGKSTLAAAFYQRGYRVLTDDVCVIAMDQGKPVAYPGYPRVHLWADVLDRLDWELPRLILRAKLAKYGVPLQAQFAVQPVPLYAVYELEVANTPCITVQPLKDKEKFAVLVTHTYRSHFLNGLGLRRRHFAQAVTVARPVKVHRVTRSQQPFLLDELVQVLEGDF